MVCKVCGIGAPAYCPICFLAAKGSTAKTGGTQPTDVQQLKQAIALLNRWMGDPEQDLLLSDTDRFVRDSATACI